MNQIKVIAFDLMGVILAEKATSDPIFTDFDIHFDLDDQGFYPWVKNKYNLDRKQAFDKTNQLMDQYYQLRDPSVFNLANHYKFALASNHLSNIDDFLDRQGVLKYFSWIIISSEIGLRKPDPEYFKILLKKIGQPPADILFIDDLPENCDSARKLGINVFNFNPSHDQYNLEQQVEKELAKFEL